MSFEVKKKALEKEVNTLVKEIRLGPFCETEFAIYEEFGVQVKVVVTRDDDSMIEELDSNYVDAIE